MADITDIQLRKKLKELGEDIGPITHSTRNIYVKKLQSLEKNNNKSVKSLRKSESIFNTIPDSSFSKNNDHNNKINSPTISLNRNSISDKNINKNFQSENVFNRITQTEFVSPPRTNYANLPPDTTTSSRRTEILYSNRFEHKPTLSYEQNSSLDNDMQNFAELNRRKEMYTKHVSPMTYSTVPDRHRSTIKHPIYDYNLSTKAAEEQANTNNNVKKWYNGSLGSLSSYFTNRKDRDDLMDISDGDLSDNDSNLIARLRRNYFKKSRSLDVDKSKTKKQLEKKSYLSFPDLNQLPNILLLAFIIFSVVLFSSYLMMKNRYSHQELDLAIDRLICRNEQTRDCFTESEMPLLKSYLSRLYNILSEHSGTQMCEFNNNKRMPFMNAREILNYQLKRDKFSLINEKDWSQLIKLIIKLPRDKLDIIGYDNFNKVVDIDGLPEEVTYLEGLKAKRSVFCRLKMYVTYMVNWMAYLLFMLLVLVVLIVLGYCINVYRLRKKEIYERHISELRDIVSSISGLLQDQLRLSEYNVGTDQFLSLIKIRSILQQTYPKLRDNKFWDQVKRFMYKSEPLIELKETMAHGEILQWKCRPGWQGSAVLNECQVKFEKGPTECLKIRNMDLQQLDENGKNYLRREIMNRIKEAGEVKDIKFITKGVKVIVYVMCASREVAGEAFRKINANYFNGNLLNVKFIRLDKYLERFPESKIYVK